ncbi:MAG: sugar phosphate isomerase/epimerase family protein, partial [Verrucomicrobiota bacterium]
MKTPPSLSRRRLLQAAPALLATPLWGAEESTSFPLKGVLFKTLKIGMTSKAGKTLTERFKAAKEAGFGAIELNCPGSDVEEVKKAIDESGLPVDGSVCAAHWQVRHTDPDPAIRAKALENLKGALRETKAVGGDTVLLVVGHGKDGPAEEIDARSIENISKAIPLAEELGVPIAVENVWNQMHYDHGGPADQSADRLASYIDAFDSPMVGMQFDIGNHW